MQDIRKTIAEYKTSHALVKARIHELNALISKRAPSREDSSVKKLIDRRSLLYTQLWDIEYAIRELDEYLHAVYGWEVNQRVG